MKKILMLTAAFLSLMLCFSNAYALDYMLANEKYLIEDDMYYATGTPGGDGWDTHEAGGKIGVGWGRYVISDTSPYLPVDMTKKFKEISSGKAEMEYTFYFTEDIDGFKWQVRNGDNAVITLKTKNHGIYAEAEGMDDIWLSEYHTDIALDGVATNKQLESDAVYGVRISMDLDSKLYRVYINGALCGENIPMASNVINNVFFTSTAEGTGKLFVYPLRLYKDYYLNETFVSTVPGKTTLPSYMDVSNEGGSVAVEYMRSQLWFDVYNLRMKSNGTGDVHYAKALNINDDLVAFEFFVIDTDGTGGFRARLGNSMDISMNKGDFSFCGTPFYKNYVKNLWYRVKVIADYSKGMCDLYINNIKQAENVSIGGEDRKRVSFEAIPGENMNIGLDDILIYPMQPEPSDYVSRPEVSDNPSVDVGIMSCSLWRSGKQTGWDRIAPFPERKPLLGWYDEGNPELSDWETKIMTEHGVDFQVYCWFKPDGSNDTPIKTPNWSYAIEAYKCSKYSDMIKYCFLYENLTASCDTIDDFKEHIAPYWIEHYFKDPRYYKIDGKPVVTIHDMGRFVKQVSGGGSSKMDDSSYALAAEAVKYLKDECEKAGLGGLILMTNSVADSSRYADPEKMKLIGVEAGYPYGGIFGTNPAVLKKTYISVAENSGVDVIAASTMGFDAYPWTGVRGEMTSIESFTENCRWIKEEFMTGAARGKYGKKLVMLDNWNELGEGHFLQPTAGGGWGYMDAVKKYFGGDDECTHELPAQNQADRIHVLYDQQRTGYRVQTEDETNNYPSKVLKGWYFNNDTEGWSFNSHVKSAETENGVLKIVSSGADPIMYSPSGLSINADEVSYIKVRMKRSDDAAAMGEFFFVTDLLPDWVWNQNYRFITENGYFKDYYIKVSSNDAWSGTLTRLRFDPFDGTGEAWIASIELLGETENAENCIVTDGKITDIRPEIINDTTYLPLTDTFKSCTDAVFDWNTDGSEMLEFVIGDDAYVVTAGEKRYFYNGLYYESDSMFVMNNNTLYAPLEFFKNISEHTGTSYDEQSNTAYIYDKRLRVYKFNNKKNDENGKIYYDGYDEDFIGCGYGVSQISNISKGERSLKLCFSKEWNWVGISLPPSDKKKTYTVTIPMQRISDTGRFLYMSAGGEKKAEHNNETAVFKGGATMNLEAKNQWYTYKKTFTLEPNEPHYVYITVDGISAVGGIDINIDNVRIEELPSPEVSEVFPRADETEVSLVAEPRISFISEINADTKNEIYLAASDNERIAAECVVSDDNKTVRLIPCRALLPDTRYKIVITPSLKGANGSEFAGEEYYFTTGNNIGYRYTFESEEENSNGDVIYDGCGEHVLYKRSGAWNPEASRTAEESGFALRLKFSDIWNYGEIRLPKSDKPVSYRVRIPMKRTSETGRFIYMSAGERAVSNSQTTAYKGGATMNLEDKDKWYVYDKIFTLDPSENHSVYMTVNGIGAAEGTGITINIDNLIIEELRPKITLYKNGSRMSNLSFTVADAGAEISAEFSNIAGNGEKYTGFLAVYNGGHLKKANIIRISADAGKISEGGPLSILLPDKPEECRIAAFLWDESQMPAAEPIFVLQNGEREEPK